jgi:hypothetical protein
MKAILIIIISSSSSRGSEVFVRTMVASRRRFRNPIKTPAVSPLDE